MRLIVCPRWRVNQLDLDVWHAVISISDPPPHGSPATIAKRWGQAAVRRWAFWDLDDRWPGPHEELITPAQAAEIWAFVHEFRDQVEAFVIHCEAGAPSIAMALADVLWDRSVIEWKCPDDDVNGTAPNVYVYDRMMQAVV